MNIYDYKDYRSYLNHWIKSQPGGGRGLLKKWAEECSVHSTLLSQILSGKKEMSLELAEQIAGQLGLSEAEFDYFMFLVLHARAGTVKLKNRLQKKIQTLREQSENIGKRLQVEGRVSDEDQSVFYSSWMYAGIRNLTATPKGQNVDAIADHLKLPRPLVQEIIHFLIASGLCSLESGKLTVGTKRTHIHAESPYVTQHHQNWRSYGFQKMLLRKNSDLFFTFPMSLSRKDSEKIRSLLPTFIESIHKIVGPSESETTRCLNIDYFDY